MSPKPLLAVVTGVAACLFVGELVTHGQPNTNDDEAVLATLDADVKQFLDTVAAGEADTALRVLLTDSELNPQSEDVQTLAAKTLALKTKYGEFRGFERVDAQRVATDLVVMKYLYKCERFPVVWYFTFYRGAAAGAGNGQWSVVTIRFDTELELLAL